MTADEPEPQSPRDNLGWATLARLSRLIGLEKRILGILFSYAVAIGLFSLIVPLTVQELVNTFAFAIQPVMIVTLAGIMLAGLLFIGAFKVLQARGVETLQQRIYTRVALAMTEHLPRLREEAFLPRHVNHFIEAEFLTRAVVAMLIDAVNVLISGTIGMAILVMYHPYFLGYNVLLISGFVFVATVFGQGGFRITQRMSRLNYEVFNWLQDVGHNRLHFKATESMPLLLKRTDELVRAYVKVRQTKSDILTGRQYKSAVIWQAFGHSGMIGLGGWLLSVGNITLGQFVAAEVIVGTLILNLDTVARRMYAVFYIFTSLDELATFFSLPKEMPFVQITASLPDPSIHGVRVTCKDVSFAYANAPPVFEHFDLEIAPGEKVAVLSHTSIGKTTLALVLAGLYSPTFGVIRYNDVDLRDVDMEYINRHRGLVLDSRVSLFEGTLEENISLHRPSIQFDDLRWALRFVELEEEVDAMPQGFDTPVLARGKNFTNSQILRILLARAIVIRPPLLVFDGTLHLIEPELRTTLLRRLCAKEEPWSVIFVSSDPTISTLVDRRIVLD